MDWPAVRRWAAKETRGIIVKEFLKVVVLTILALALGWLLSFINALFDLETPLTLDTLGTRVSALARAFWDHPYDLSVGLLKSDRYQTIVWFLLVGAILFLGFLLRRARWRIKYQAGLLDAAAADQALVVQAGLGGRWPHAKPDGTGAPWHDLAAEILHPQNNVLNILGANGVDTFGKVGSPLYETLSQFQGTVRVILVSPKSKEVTGRSRAVGDDPQNYKSAIETSVRRLRALKGQHHGIEGRFYDGQPNWKLIITGRTVWMQYYMPGGLHVDQTPCWRFDLTQTEGGLYHYFHMEFERVWRRCEDDPMNLR